MTQSTPPAGGNTLAPERPSSQPDSPIGKDATATQAPTHIEITTHKPGSPKPLPTPDGDFYHFKELLSEDERKVLDDVRTFMETKVQPIINDYWLRDEFPFELIPEFKKLGYAGVGIDGYGCYGGTQLLF